MMLLGIDVSVWQDNNSTPQMMDFHKARAAGAHYVFIKASQACWMDSDLLLNWQNAKQAGLPRGAYHYLDWTQPAGDQARFFCGLLRADPGELPPVLDYECRRGVGSRNSASIAALEFLEIVEDELGRVPIVYTSPGFWAEYGTSAAGWERYSLWIANYMVSAPYIPAPWTGFTFWQYTDRGNGPLFGAESAGLDLNWFNGDHADLAALCQTAAPFVPPEPAAPPEPIEGLRYRAKQRFNIRSGPGTRYSDIGDLQTGDKIGVQDIGGEDVWVEFGPGQWCAMRTGGRTYLERIT